MSQRVPETPGTHLPLSGGREKPLHMDVTERVSAASFFLSLPWTGDLQLGQGTWLVPRGGGDQRWDSGLCAWRPWLSGEDLGNPPEGT